MAKRSLGICAALSLAFVLGCPIVVPPPPPEAVLEGTWSLTPAEPGEFADWDFEAVFDSSGNLTALTATREDGATATLDTTGATTELNEAEVTITIPNATGARIFEGTLSADQNTMTGSITQELDLGDLEAILPGGELTLERILADDPDPCEGVTCDPGEECEEGECVAVDPCEGVTCDPGEECEEGECVAVDPCEGVTCDPGEECVDGECVAVDPCEGVTCDPGEECVDGQCVAVDPCEGVTCDPGEMCVDGQCVPETSTPDPAAGEAYYMANNCAACHGEDATGPPSLIGVDANTIFDKLSGNVSHVGGTFEGVMEEDAANLAAWLGSL